jgi:hypothetical protein
MNFDPEILRQQNEAILNGLSSMHQELSAFENKSSKDDAFDNERSMSEILKEKRENTEKILESTKTNH